MKKRFAILFIFTLFISSVFADNLDESTNLFSDELKAEVKLGLSKIFKNETVNELLEKNKILVYKYSEDNMQADISPLLDILNKMKTSLNPKDFSPVFLMESLYIFPKKKSGKKDTEDIAKILKSISKLKGLEYYSYSREAMRTLYKDSFVVKKIKRDDNSFDYKAVDDPIDRATDGLSILACQEDLTFGRYIYRYDYFLGDGEIASVCTNTEALKYKIFKLISAENLRVGLLVKEYKNFVLVYCSTGASFTRFPGLKNKLKNSFSSRADAMYKWFVNEYRKVKIGG